ncbi:MAG: ComEC/Rec2 family competence protein [Salinarimonas sp.]
MGEIARGAATGGDERGFAAAGAHAAYDEADRTDSRRADRILAACGAWLSDCLAEEVSRRRLFPWCAVAFGLGIILFFAAEGRPHAAAPLAGLALCAFIAFLGRHDHRLLRITIAVAMVLAGFTATMLRFERVDAPIIDAIRIAQLTGSVISIEERTGDARLVIRVAAIDDLARDALPARVRVTTRAAGGLRAGDTITARVRLMPPPEAAWPGGYDFARSAWFARIGGVGSILGGARIAAPETPPGFAERVRATIDNARVSTTRRIFDAIGGQPGAVAAALVTGKRGLITEETNAALRAAGIYHIVSISGLHMVLAAGTIFWLTRAGLALVPALALGWPIKKIAAVTAIMGAAGYCIFSGAQVATIRAVIMTGVMLGAVLFDRPALSMRNLAIAAILVLAWQPETLLGPSFQMSFSAVVGLIAGAEWMRARESRPGPTPGAAGRFLRWLAAGMLGIVTTTIIATIATGPFAAYHFQIANPYGLIGNALALPIVSLVVMPAGVIGVLLIGFGLDHMAWQVMGFGIARVLDVAHFVAGFEGSNLPVAAFGNGALALMVIGLLTATLFVSPLRRLAVIPAGIGFALAMTPDRPDLYVDRNGAGAAIRGADGRLVLLGRPSAFVTAQWLKADGDARLMTGAPEDATASLHAGVNCDTLGCTKSFAAGHAAAFVTDARAFAEDCARAAIIITPLEAPASCAAARVIDQATLREFGAVSAHFAAGVGSGEPAIREVRSNWEGILEVGGEDLAGGDGVAGRVAGGPSADPIRRMTGVRRANETRPWLVRQSEM